LLAKFRKEKRLNNVSISKVCRQLLKAAINELIRQGVLMKKSGVVDIQNAPNSQPKKKKLNQRIQILHKLHLGSASCIRGAAPQLFHKEGCA
jgi:hypothetical protein